MLEDENLKWLCGHFNVVSDTGSHKLIFLPRQASEKIFEVILTIAANFYA